MRIVEWTDEKGFNHRSLVRDNDGDNMAPEGILQDPPDLSRIDWEEVQQELHNMLLSRGLVTWNDVQAAQNGVTSAIVSVLKRRVIHLYREKV